MTSDRSVVDIAWLATPEGNIVLPWCPPITEEMAKPTLSSACSGPIEVSIMRGGAAR
jgi:hypothetical protein